LKRSRSKLCFHFAISSSLHAILPWMLPYFLQYWYCICHCLQKNFIIELKQSHIMDFLKMSGRIYRRCNNTVPWIEGRVKVNFWEHFTTGTGVFVYWSFPSTIPAG
jgi:hypothetical protein